MIMFLCSIRRFWVFVGLWISEKVEDLSGVDSDAFCFDQIQKSVSIDAAFVSSVDGRIVG